VTKKSLVIIDELGRGTSTSDGQSIALATLEKLHELKAKTLFSTHYHQLTEINLPRIKNYHLDIIENDDGSINFIRKLQPGSTDKSYGIHIAKLAGIPDDVIIRAFEILDQIEEKDPFKATVEENGNGKLTNKYYDKFIQEKKKALERLNLDLDVKQREMNECEAELIKKERELGQKKFEVEKKKEQLTNLKDQSDITKKPKTHINKEKKYMQTTFFKPSIKKVMALDKNAKELIDIIKEIEINSLTPIEAMKKLIFLKEKLSNFIN
jgi:DNA mismatch repair ATPase MutS